jgi:hypothetical protein
MSRTKLVFPSKFRVECGDGGVRHRRQAGAIAVLNRFG